MLDDLKFIHEKDAQDALGVAAKQFEQVTQEYDVPVSRGDYDNVVLSGMGGSALAALVAQSWPGLNVPFEISRGYTIPSYVGNRTLFFASSYSGNTEETLSALAEAESRGAHCMVIASGGKLADIAREKNYVLAQLPGGYQPRHALLYSLKALLTILDKAGLTNNAAGELAAQADFLKNIVANWQPTVPASQNRAKQIAQELMGKSVVVYAGPKLAPAAYKWKISVNENAKQIAWWNQFPEFNHNEFLGWTEQPVQKPYAVVELRSNLEHERVQKRFEVTERLLSGRRPAPIVIKPTGDGLLQQLLWTIVLGDFVTLYLALLNGLNPTPVDLIEKFKTALTE